MVKVCAVALVSLFAFAPVIAEPAAPKVRAVAYVNSNSNAGTGTNATVTLNGVTNGNTLVAVLGNGLAGTTASSVTDDASGGSNTYTSRCGRQFQTGGGGVQIWVAESVVGGNLTLTIGMSGSVDWGIGLAEYSGATGFDAASSGSGGNSTTPSTNITTGVANAMIIGGFNYAAGSSAFTQGTGYTLRENPHPGQWMAMEDQVVTSATTYAVDGTITSANWAACAVSLAPSGGGAASFVPAIINNPVGRGGGLWLWFFRQLFG